MEQATSRDSEKLGSVVRSVALAPEQDEWLQQRKISLHRSVSIIIRDLVQEAIDRERQAKQAN